jgi:lipopolysaccharide export system permease protein
MNILRRIILKEWFKFFFYSLITLFMLISIASLVAGLLRSNVSTKDVLINFLLDIPLNLERIFPISCLIASLFSVNKLKSTNELTAIFSTGFSQNSYALTIFFCASFVASFQFLLTGYLKPYLYSRKEIFKVDRQDHLNSKTRGLSTSSLATGKIWFKSGNYFLAFESYEKATSTLKNISLFYYDGTAKVERAILADTLTYQKGNSWLLKDGISFNTLNTQADFPESKPFTKMFTYLEEVPADFMQIESDITTLNFADLYSYIDRLNNSGLDTSSFKMTFYEKISGSLISIIFALFALYPIFNPSRRQSSFGKNAFFVFVLSIGYWFVNSYFAELGQNAKLIPILASFLIPLFFALYTSFFFHKNQRLN